MNLSRAWLVARLALARRGLLVWPAIAVVAALAPQACEDPIAPADLLTEPRILAIRSEPPDMIPLSQTAAMGQVTLDALLYLPPGSPAPTYSWSWCATVGATLQCATTAAALEAIVDPGGVNGITIDYSLGSGATAVFPYPVSPDVLESVCVRFPGGLDDGGLDAGDDGALDDASFAEGGLAGKLVCAGDSWPVSVLLTVSVGSTTLQAERSLTVYLTPPTTANTNPTIDGLRPFTTALAAATDGGALASPGEEADGGAEDAGVGSVVDGAVTLAAEVPAAATDLYVGRAPGEGPVDASGEDAGCVPEDGGVEDGGLEADGGAVSCAPSPQQEVYESLDMAWYIGGGVIARATTTMPGVPFGRAQDWSSVLLNQWTPPSQAGAYPIVVVVRDNRGGVGWRVQSAAVPVE